VANRYVALVASAVIVAVMTSASESPGLYGDSELGLGDLDGELEGRPPLSRKQTTHDAVGHIELASDVGRRESELLHPRAKLIVGRDTVSHNQNIADQQTLVNRQESPQMTDGLAIGQDDAVKIKDSPEKLTERQQKAKDSAVAFGKMIRTAMEKRGLNQRQLANMADMSESNVSRLLKGQRPNLQADTSAKLLSALGIGSGTTLRLNTNVAMPEEVKEILEEYKWPSRMSDADYEEVRVRFCLRYQKTWVKSWAQSRLKEIVREVMDRDLVGSNEEGES
jgi:transcriptional regulator with XRE-family HTH domain